MSSTAGCVPADVRGLFSTSKHAPASRTLTHHVYGPFTEAEVCLLNAANGFLLQEHVPLAPFTTFGIGGPARWFTQVRDEAELSAACAWAAQQQVPVFVLGGGSNILVADTGFAGLVLQIGLRGFAEHDEGDRRVFAVAAGEDWDTLVTRTVEAKCAGMECLAGIPGSVGGTPVQNVGAYGQEVAQTITSLRCYDRHTQTFVTFTAAACGFAYRTSRFNSEPDRGRYIVTQVSFALVPGGAPALAYADLQRYFAGRATTPSLVEVAAAVRTIRRQKGMVVDSGILTHRDPDTRSAGSFFKNPVVAESLFQEVCQVVRTAGDTTSSVPSYPAPASAAGAAQRKIPAAWLLEQAGFRKGFAVGGAAVSSKHTLALTNHSGRATAAEIIALRDVLAAGVEKRFGIRLEQEPIVVG